MTSCATSGERGSAVVEVIGCVGVVGGSGAVCGLQAMSVTSEAAVRTRRMVMDPAAACAMPALQAGARSPCYNRVVASRSQTEQQQQSSLEIGEVLNRTRAQRHMKRRVAKRVLARCSIKRW